MDRRSLARVWREFGLISANTLLAFIALNAVVWALRPGRKPVPSSPVPSLAAYGESSPEWAAAMREGGLALQRSGTVVRPYVLTGMPFFKGIAVNIDRDEKGFERRRTGSESGGSEDIFLFGGGAALSPWLGDDATIAYHLQAALGRRRLPCRVANYAARGQGPGEAQLLFQRLLHAGHRPILAVFLDDAEGAGDEPRALHRSLARLWEARQRGIASHILPAWIPVFDWINDIQAARRERELARIEIERYPWATLTTDAESLVKRYDESLRQRRAIARASGVDARFFWIPHPAASCPQEGALPPAAGRLITLSSHAFSIRSPDFQTLGDCARAGFLVGNHPTPALAEVLGESIAEALVPAKTAPRRAQGEDLRG